MPDTLGRNRRGWIASQPDNSQKLVIKIRVEFKNLGNK